MDPSSVYHLNLNLPNLSELETTMLLPLVFSQTSLEKNFLVLIVVREPHQTVSTKKSINCWLEEVAYSRDSACE
jgi:hypothetical protein